MIQKMDSMIIGYARESTVDQFLNLQLDAKRI